MNVAVAGAVGETLALKTVWKRFQNDIQNRKNLDAYLAIVTAFAAAIISASGLLSAAGALSLALAALGLIVIDLVRISHKSDKISDQLSLLSRQPPVRHKDISEYMNENIQLASTVSVLSVVNYTFLSRNMPALSSLVERGGCLRVLQADDSRPDLVEIALLRDPSRDQNYIRHQMGMSLSKLRALAGYGVDRVVVRKVPYATAHILTWFEFPQGPGMMFVIPSGFRQRTHSRPVLVFNELEDPAVYRYFVEYFDNLWDWDRAETVSLNAE